MNPLIIDFDGTLINVETVTYLRARWRLQHPFEMQQLKSWRQVSKQNEKIQLWRNMPNIVDKLHYRRSVLSLINDYKTQGSGVYLVSGSSHELVGMVASHLGVFDGFQGSTSHVNLTRDAKLNYLSSAFGYQSFDYVGNSIADISVWEGSGKAYVVNPSKELRLELLIRDMKPRVIIEKNIRQKFLNVSRLLFSI